MAVAHGVGVWAVGGYPLDVHMSSAGREGPRMRVSIRFRLSLCAFIRTTSLCVSDGRTVHACMYKHKIPLVFIGTPPNEDDTEI